MASGDDSGGSDLDLPGHTEFDDELEYLLRHVADLESELDRWIDGGILDDESETRLAAADMWVSIALRALNTLQAPFPLSRSAEVLREVLDLDRRKRKSADEREADKRGLFERRDAGEITQEDFDRRLQRWEFWEEYINERPAPPSDNEILRYKMFLQVARSAIRELPTVTANTLSLAPWALTVKLPETVGHYVARVARNFIDGRHLEGVIVARAVLDAAMKEKVRDSDVVASESKIARESEVTLLHRIRAAESTGLISAEAARTAHAIRIKGNDAVHVNSPPSDGFVGDFDYLRGLTKVLVELYPREEGRAPSGDRLRDLD